MCQQHRPTASALSNAHPQHRSLLRGVLLLHVAVAQILSYASGIVVDLCDGACGGEDSVNCGHQSASGDITDGLGLALAEHEPHARLDVLGVLDEAEAHLGLVAGTQMRLRHADDRGGLAHGPDVHHGLVADRDRRRVVQDQQVGRELPGRPRVQQRRQHHHALRRATILPWDIAARWNTLRIWLRLIFFSENDADWLPRTSRTGMRFRWMLLIGCGEKLPSGSGPSSSTSLTRMMPFRHVPDTTVPTPCHDAMSY